MQTRPSIRREQVSRVLNAFAMTSPRTMEDQPPSSPPFASPTKVAPKPNRGKRRVLIAVVAILAIIVIAGIWYAITPASPMGSMTSTSETSVNPLYPYSTCSYWSGLQGAPCYVLNMNSSILYGTFYTISGVCEGPYSCDKSWNYGTNASGSSNFAVKSFNISSAQPMFVRFNATFPLGFVIRSVRDSEGNPISRTVLDVNTSRLSGTYQMSTGSFVLYIINFQPSDATFSIAAYLPQSALD
jgi:hypothetical protein